MRPKLRRFLIPLFLVLTIASISRAETLSSPDGRLILAIEVQPPANATDSGTGQIVYHVTFRGKPLVEQSALRLELEGQHPLGTDVHIVGATPSSADETYRLITKDATTYSLILPNFRSMYESEFVKLPISAFSNQGGVASKVLIGLPTLMARRHNKDWFVGALTGWDPRDLDLSLDFLSPGNYTATIYADAPDADKNPTNVRIETKSVTRSSRLTAKLAPAGGYAVHLTPVR